MTRRKVSFCTMSGSKIGIFISPPLRDAELYLSAVSLGNKLLFWEGKSTLVLKVKALLKSRRLHCRATPFTVARARYRRVLCSFWARKWICCTPGCKVKRSLTILEPCERLVMKVICFALYWTYAAGSEGVLTPTIVSVLRVSCADGWSGQRRLIVPLRRLPGDYEPVYSLEGHLLRVLSLHLERIVWFDGSTTLLQI